jgi:hypothetical protein
MITLLGMAGGLVLLLAGAIILIVFVVRKLGGNKLPGGFEFSDNKGSVIKVSPVEHPDYNSTMYIIDRFLKRTKDNLRVWVHRNGWSKLEDREWFEYKQKKVEMIGREITTFVIDNYRSYKLVPQDELVKYVTDNIMKPINEMLMNLFDDTRKIADEQYSKIDLMIKDLDEFKSRESELIFKHPDRAQISYIMTDYGFKVIEIHEMKNRELMSKQMDKVDEYIRDMYNQFASSINTLITQAMESKDKE